MRIAMLSWETLHSIPVGGVATHVTELSAAIERRGHEVHVFTRLAAGQMRYERIDGVHYHRCAIPPNGDFVDEVNEMCRRFVDQLFWTEDFTGPFDIVHAHDWLTANAMIWIKQALPQRRCLLTMHSTEYGRSGNVFHDGESHRVRDQERAGNYWADQVIAVSGATKRELAWMYEVPETKISVVYNGVSPGRFQLKVDVAAVRRRYAVGPLDPLILFCGRLAHQKAPDLLLEAFPAVLNYYGAAKLVFAGDGDMRPSLERRAHQLGVAHAARFLGYRADKELVELFRMCDVVCVPSRNEPFGIVVLEAWSAGKPVVATNCGGPDEFVWHETNGLKVYPNPDSIAWGLGTMFMDFKRARWMGANGHHVVEVAFTWDHISQQMLDVYAPPSAHAAPDDQQPAEAGDGPAKPVRTTGSKPSPARQPTKQPRRARRTHADKSNAPQRQMAPTTTP